MHAVELWIDGDFISKENTLINVLETGGDLTPVGHLRSLANFG